MRYRIIHNISTKINLRRRKYDLNQFAIVNFPVKKRQSS